MKITLVLMSLAVGLCMSGCRTAEHVENGTEHVAKKTGHAVGHATAKVGHAIERGGDKLQDKTEQ